MLSKIYNIYIYIYINEFSFPSSNCNLPMANLASSPYIVRHLRLNLHLVLNEFVTNGTRSIATIRGISRGFFFNSLFYLFLSFFVTFLDLSFSFRSEGTREIVRVVSSSRTGLSLTKAPTIRGTLSVARTVNSDSSKPSVT